MKTTARSIVWGAAAAAVLAIGVFGAGVPANAATDGPNLDPTQTGSIDIHKFAQPATPTGQANDGTSLSPSQLAGLTPLQGVQFTVQKVGGIDLTTNAGWAATQGLTAATVQGDPTDYPLSAVPGGVLTTNGAGDAALANLPLGVYLVTETSTGGNPITTMTAPFLVSIPMPQNGSSSWLYDVNVYPKNSVTAVNKTVDDSRAQGIGDPVDWEITGMVPNEGPGKSVTSAVITDPIDPALSLSSVTVTLKDASGAAVALDPSDYTITPTAPAASPVGTVTVTFTPAGLAVLTANQGGTVDVKIGTIVQALGATGTITDKGTVNFDGAPIDTPEVETQFGALQIIKVAQDDPTKTLQGAQYQVFASQADAQAGTPAITSGGTSTFTTDANGQVVIPGLKIAQGQTSQDYWILETKAPVGYQVNTTPIKVTVTPNGTSTAPDSQTVSDVQIPPFMLPLTGSTGTLIYTAGGLTLALLAAALVIIIAARRRQAALQAE